LLLKNFAIFSSLCPSVIEHVTGSKDFAYHTEDGRQFAASARRAQANFAAEIRRVAKHSSRSSHREKTAAIVRWHSSRRR